MNPMRLTAYAEVDLRGRVKYGKCSRGNSVLQGTEFTEFTLKTGPSLLWIWDCSDGPMGEAKKYHHLPNRVLLPSLFFS